MLASASCARRSSLDVGAELEAVVPEVGLAVGSEVPAVAPVCAWFSAAVLVD